MLGRAVLSGVLLLMACERAPAQTYRTFQNPATLRPATPERQPGLAFRMPAPKEAAPQREVTYDLDVNYTDTQIFNPSTGQDDAVHLRSYNGSLIAPTINVYPAQTVRLRLHNKLPVENEADCPPPNARNHTVPSCLNTTNLHFHGLHVSPVGNSDNVLLEIAPAQNFEYEVNIPADHPAGTFWYHSHRHGSTALQVSSGMVGALIVRGTRTLAQRDQNGGIADIDTILKKAGGAAIDEDILLFQQIAYACFTAANSATIVTTPTSDGKTVWSCPQGQAGQVQYYSTQFGPPTWPASGRYTMITGQVQPTFGEVQAGQGKPIRAGDLVRWRMIHAGVRDTVNVKIVKATGLDDPAATPPDGAQEQANWVDQHCSAGVVVPQWEFAVDGLTRIHPQMKQTNVLQPGYRSDVLLAFPSAGTYCIIDQAAPNTAIITPRPDGKDRRLLGMAVVKGSQAIQGDMAAYIVGKLIAANTGMPADVKTQLMNQDLSAFVPTADLSHETTAQTRQVAFNIVPTTGNPFRFEINDAIYNPQRVDFQPKLGTIEDWDITSELGGHVFHIHVNPFEIIDIKDPTGTSIFGADGHCTELDLKNPQGDPTPDPQYCDLKGVFRDTIFVKQNYHIIIRTAYTRYIGEFVLHCHILDHEDQGMMLNVEVVPEGENQLASAPLPSQIGGHSHSGP